VAAAAWAAWAIWISKVCPLTKRHKGPVATPGLFALVNEQGGQMLVYCSNFKLQPGIGISAIAEVIARWLGTKAKCFVRPEDIIQGIDQRLKDGSRVESLSTIAHNQSYPLLMSVNLSHAGDVPGRQWSTEIGIKQDLPNAPIQCSVLLQTHEISARVVAPIQPTRPYVVEELFRHCAPLASTPGASEHYLDENNAKAFSYFLEHRNREVPWIIVSPTREGKYLVNTKRLRSLLLGVAEVLEIPAGTNTFEVQEKLGSRYAVWLGAINIIYPSRQDQGKAFYETHRFMPDNIQDFIEEGRQPENEIFSIITHRTNLPNSWKHISPSAVINARLRIQLNASIQKAKGSEEAGEYIELLQEADKELKTKDSELESLRLEFEGKEEQILKLEADVEGLKYALSGKRTAGDNDDAIKGLAPLRAATLGALDGSITLEQALHLVGALFPERIIVTETAFSSASASNTFHYCSKALELMLKLATSYWDDLVAGRPDAEARKVFGNSYAAKESESLTNEGKKRRTFMVDGRPIEMQRHLKIGIKDSASETLRVHFEWISSEKKIAIGYCGAHLDF
jgi:hypothetical protein